MSNKKRVKSGERSQTLNRFIPLGLRWDISLSADQINEEKWSLHLTMLVPNHSEECVHLDALSEWIKTGKPIRRLFATISKEELIKIVNEIGSSKGGGKKPKELPLYYECCEVAKQYLDAGEEIPLPLLARLVKFRLLAIKVADQQRREAELKGADDKKAKKGGEKKPADKPKRGASGKKGGEKKAVAGDEPPSAKEGTKLRKRGEEDLEGKYIDDEPDDGVQQYVLMTGFHAPYLLPLLSEIGVQVDALIQVRAPSSGLASEGASARSEGPAPLGDQVAETARTEDTLGDLTVTATATAATERTAGGTSERSEAQASGSGSGSGSSAGGGGAKQLNKAQLEAAAEQRKILERTEKELRLFWRDVRLLLSAQPPTSLLYNTPLLDYEFKVFLLTSSEAATLDQAKVDFMMNTFEDLAVKIYDLLDLRRQWKNYLSNTKLFRVPQLVTDPELAGVGGTGASASPTPRGGQGSGGETQAPPTPGAGGQQASAPDGAAQASQAPAAANTGGATGPVSGEPAAGNPGAEGEATPGQGTTPTPTDSGPRSLFAQTDMRYYNDLLSFVPEQCGSVELVLFALVEQVSATIENRPPVSETQPNQTKEGIVQTIQNYFDYQTSKLPLLARSYKAGGNREATRVASMLGTSAAAGPVEFIHALDSSLQRTRHLDENANVRAPLPSFGLSTLSNMGSAPLATQRDASRVVFSHAQPCNVFEPRAAELHMLSLSSPFREARAALREALETEAESGNSNGYLASYETRLHELFHFIEKEKLGKLEIERSLRQFMLESLRLQSTDTFGFLPNVANLSTSSGDQRNDQEARAKALQRIFGENREALFWDDPYAMLKPKFAARRPRKRPAHHQQEVRERAASTSARVQSPAARPNSSGILKSRSASAKSRKSSVSVKFEVAGERRSREEVPAASVLPPGSASEAPSGAQPSEGSDAGGSQEQSPLEKHLAEDLLSQLLGAQQRNLDEWCFAERLPPEVMLQQLREAAYEMRALEAYYVRHEHALALVLQNPRAASERGLQCAQGWSCWLHANVGFRNYLEHVMDKIIDWTKSEEAKYQAEMLRKELERQRELEEAARAAAEAAEAETSKGKGGKKNSGKEDAKGKKPAGKGAAAKSGTGSRGGSRASSAERSGSEDELLIRDESIKAQKKRQEQERLEREETERAKAEAKERKGSGKKGKPAGEPGAESGRKSGGSQKGSRSPSPRSQAGSRTQSGEREATTVPSGTETQRAPGEKYWPFEGYDLCDNLPHIGGTLTALYPSDGGIVRVERADRVEDGTLVRTTLLKDGHVLAVHTNDPLKGYVKPAISAALASGSGGLAPVQQENTTVFEPGTGKENCVASYFGSFSAQLNDGICLSFSPYGPKGEPSGVSRPKPETPAYLKDIPVGTGGAGSEAGSGAGSARGTPSPKGKRGKSEKSGGEPESGTEDEGGSPSRDKHKRDKDGARMTAGSGVSELDTQRALGQAAQALEEGKEGAAAGTRIGSLFVSAPNAATLTFSPEEAIGISMAASQVEVLSGRNSSLSERQGASPSITGRMCVKLTAPPTVTQPVPSASPPRVERVRFVTGEGRVFSVFTDGSLEILCPDGSKILRADYNYVAKTCNLLKPGARLPSAVSSGGQQEKGAGAVKGKGARAKQRQTSGGSEAKSATATKNLFCWVRTGPAGSRSAIIEDGDSLAPGASGVPNFVGTIECIELAPPVVASDPSTAQVISTRDDGTVLLSGSGSPSNELQVVEFADGTRITTESRAATRQLLARDRDTGEFASPNGEHESHGEAVERVVVVENSLYPTLTFSEASASCTARFASGTEVQAVLASGASAGQASDAQSGSGVGGDSSRVDAPLTPKSLPSGNAAAHETHTLPPLPKLLMYQVRTQNGGQLVIDAHSTVQYIPRVSPILGFMQRRRCAYTMRVNANVVCEVEDDEQNLFQVTADGQSTVTPVRPASTASSQADSSHQTLGPAAALGQQANVAHQRLQQAVAYYRQHRPRFFLLYDDGSGLELLRYQDLAEYLADVEADAEAAVVRESLSLSTTSLTVLRPYREPASEARWRSEYTRTTLIPPGLRARDLRSLPAAERTDLFFEHLRAERLAQEGQRERDRAKFKGTGFARHVGKGLSVPAPAALLAAEQERYRALQMRSRLKLPNAFELRSIVQYLPMNNEARGRILRGTLDYLAHMRSRELEHAELQMRETRSKEEIAAAGTLPSLARELAARQPSIIEAARQSYLNTKAREQEELLVKAAAQVGVAMQQAGAAASAASSETKASRSPAAVAKIEALALELAEARADRRALLNREVPNYFSFPLGKEMILAQAPEMGRLARDLGLLSRRGLGQSLAHAYEEQAPSVPSTASREPIPAPEPAGHTSPAHTMRSTKAAQHHAPPSLSTRLPPSLHPIWQRPSETRSEGMGPGASPFITKPNPAEVVTSLSMDAAGLPRRSPVRLPSYLNAGRPNMLPNDRYRSIEEPVRALKLNMSTVAGVPNAAGVAALRGLELQPSELDLGPVVEGRRYSAAVQVRNVGIETCHLRVHASAPELVVRYTPSALPAGLSLALQLEFAPAAVPQSPQGQGSTSDRTDQDVRTFLGQLRVSSEFEHLTLPVRASVLSRRAYAQLKPPPLPAAGVRCLATED